MDLTFGPFTLLQRDRVLAGPSGPLELSGRSFDLLKALLERPNALISKSDLLDAAWPGIAVEENTLQVHMSGLRKALGPGYIATVHGRGYRYVGPLPQPKVAADQSPPAGSNGNLSRYQVDCVAREPERQAVGELLRQHRLVSILGTGGVGKTTLALAAAADASTLFADGTWVIDLAPLTEGSLVESAIIQTLGIPFRANLPPVRAILEAVGQTGPLFLFDNCEHVAPAVARVVKALLADAPNLRILTTTQVPLGIAEEHVFKLAPFTLADAGGQSAQFLAYCYEALGERLTDAELPIVAQLCRRLDGVALALKMAAARAATLGIAAVDRQIGEHLAILSAGWEPSLERHRSLTASLRWSYELLPEADQGTLRALGVFQGSFTLEGARAVADLRSDNSMSELVRRSIVVRDGADRTRYRLLETTRHFALGQLVDKGDQTQTRLRHAEHLLGLFQAGLDSWETQPDREWHAALQPDADNLRSALEWTRSSANWPLHVALAACSYRFWIQTHLPREGLDYAEHALEHVDDTPPETRALLALALAEYYRFYRLDRRALNHLQPASAYYASGQDPVKQVQTLVLEGWCKTIVLDEEGARVAYAHMDELVSDMAPSKLKARTLVLGGIHRWAAGDRAIGRAKLEAGFAMHVATGNIRGYWKSIMLSAEIMHHGGDTSDAIELVLRVLPELRLHGNAQEYAGQLYNLCAYYVASGDYELARPLVAECGALMPRDDKNSMWCIIQNAAALLAHDGKLENAALLLGYVDAGFASWEDGRQITEAIQRERLTGLLDASGMPVLRQQQLIAQGAGLSAFEAELLAGITRPDHGSAGATASSVAAHAG